VQCYAISTCIGGSTGGAQRVWMGSAPRITNGSDVVYIYAKAQFMPAHAGVTDG
jgi:hypothetical protein